MDTQQQEAIATAKQIVYLTGQINQLDDKVKALSKGRTWNVRKLGDTRHLDDLLILSRLDTEDINAINKYVLNKMKARIRISRKKLKELTDG